MAEQPRALIYARVSTDRQEQEETIQSQLAELRARVKEDGFVVWEELMDEGYGRDNLVRPHLDRCVIWFPWEKGTKFTYRPLTAWPAGTN